MGVNPKIGGKTPPKWMVKIIENPIIMASQPTPPNVPPPEIAGLIKGL